MFEIERVTQEERKQAMLIYRDSMLSITEFFTGLAGANQSQWFSSIGHAVQGMFSGRALETLRRECLKYMEAGRIKDDFKNTDSNQLCFTELLRYLETEIPDKERWGLLKKIYIVTATEEVYDRSSPLPLQFMQIAKRLSSGEIMVLFAAYTNREIVVDAQYEFIKTLTQKSGLQYAELTSQHFESLFGKDLIKKKGSSGLEVSIESLLTPLGKAFCEYVIYYDTL